MTKMIESVNLSKIFVNKNEIVPILKNLNLSFHSGTLSVIKGRSGSGKTTLMNLLCTLDTPSEGSVFIEGIDAGSLLAKQKDEIRRTRMGFVFQSVALVPTMTAYENIDFILRINQVSASQRDERICESLAMVGLENRRASRIQELSGGEQQRVAIARALVNRPDIIFADEPTAELDSRMGFSIVALFAELAHAGGKTIIMTTHDRGLMKMADNIIEIEDAEGQFHETRGTGSITEDMSERAVEDTMDACPILYTGYQNEEENGNMAALEKTHPIGQPMKKKPIEPSPEKMPDMDLYADGKRVGGSSIRPLIECKNLRKTFSTAQAEFTVLRDVDFSVMKGQIVSVTGNSGSGKSTLLNLLGGLDRPTEGSLVINGIDMCKITDKELLAFKRQVVGFVWQNNARNLIPYLTALENVELPMLLNGRLDRSRALELLQMVDISNRRNNKADQLSGGEQQRVAIAIALANNPQILLADEPTGSVDYKITNQIMEVFRSVNSTLGTTIIIVTHDSQLAEKTDRVFHMADGRMCSDTINAF